MLRVRLDIQAMDEFVFEQVENRLKRLHQQLERLLVAHRTFVIRWQPVFRVQPQLLAFVHRRIAEVESVVSVASERITQILMVAQTQPV